MAYAPQASWKPPVQEFLTELRRERVPGSQARYNDSTLQLRDFIPKGEIRDYLRHNGRLKQILEALYPNENDRKGAADIIARYSTVFAILVYIGKGEYINNFLFHDSLSDDRLPFTARPKRFPSDTSGDVPNSDNLFDLFQDQQARFCAPTLVRGATHKFESEERLPYLEKELVGEGGSAKVYKVRVHARHDQLQWTDSGDSKGQNNYYALKAYEGLGGAKWHATETATFQKFKRTGIEDAHIIGYHCSYVHDGIPYAVLEYADMHTLEHYMMNQAGPSTDSEIVALWNNLLLVVGAICQIHDLEGDNEYSSEPSRFTGIHQDIKPTNILVKSKEGASSIYDVSFGLADLGTSSMLKASAKEPARDNFGTRAYGSPECFRRDSVDDARKIKITNKADIWSFGCVLSEICIWVLFGIGGPHGLKCYRERRLSHNSKASRGTDCFHRGGEESQVVIDEHNKAISQHRCDPTTRAILKLLPMMLHVDADKRPSATGLRKRFLEIIDKAKRSLSTSASTTSGGSQEGTVSSSYSSPLRQYRNRRSTGSIAGHEQNVYALMQTQSPRKMTSESVALTDIGHSTDAVTGASEILAKQVAHATPVARRAVNPADKAKTTPHPDKFGASTSEQRGIEKPVGLALRPALEFGSGQEHNAHAQPGTPLVSSSAPPGLSIGSPESPTSVFAPQPSRECAADPQPPHTPDPQAAHTPGTQAPRIPVSPQAHPPEPPIHLSFNDALNWKRKMKAGGPQTRLSDDYLFMQLKGRDHVFVVDDSGSMGDIRKESRERNANEVTDYIDVLSYMIKHQDKDGMDLYYLNSPEVIKHRKDSSTFVNSVRGKRFHGLTDPENNLKRILKDYIGKLTAYTSSARDNDRRSRKIRLSLGGVPKLPDPLSIYVLTDGVWMSPGAPDEEYLKDTIKELIQALRAAGCRRDQVGIQFIRFGDHMYGKQRLEALDCLGRTEGVELDIIDTTEAVDGGNVWKMLLGAINRRFDAD